MREDRVRVGGGRGLQVGISTWGFQLGFQHVGFRGERRKGRRHLWGLE